MSDINSQHPVVAKSISTLEKVADDLLNLSDETWQEGSTDDDWVAAQVRTIGRFVDNCARELRQM